MQPGSKKAIRQAQEKMKANQEKARELNKRISERGMQLFQEKFLDADFPAVIPPSARWHKFALRALLLDSPKILQMTKEKYLQAVKAKREELTNELFAGLSNALETKGPAAIGASTKVSWFSSESKAEYDLLLEEADELIKIYNDHQAEVRKEIDQILEQEFKKEQEDLNPNMN